MKKLITLIVLGMFINTIQAKTLNNLNITNKVNIENDDTFIKIYEWKVVGQGFEASGTATSLEEANKAILLVSNYEVILEKVITSAFVSSNDLKTSKTSKIYYWSVKGSVFEASGRSLSLQAAQKIIKAISGNSVQHEVIIGHK